MLASVPALYEFKIFLRKTKIWGATRKRARLKATSSLLTPILELEYAVHRNLPPYMHKLIQVLGHVCDIQVVTGLAIMVAGLAQWHGISYYHEQLVTLYFQLTLDSFWAARINYMDFDQIDHTRNHSDSPSNTSPHNHEGTPNQNDDREPRLQVRRAAVLLACILAVVWHFRVYFRENVGEGHWAEGRAGPCYRYIDRSNPLPVLVIRVSGLILFCIALGATLLFPWAWKLHRWYSAGTQGAMKWTLRRLEYSLGRLGRNATGRGISEVNITSGKPEEQDISTRNSAANTIICRFTRLITIPFAILTIAINVIILLVVFLLCQLLAIWTYGDGFYPLLWFAYFCFNIWNTFAVISIMVLNQDLINHEELEWGFGQILPLVLMLSIVFVAVDVVSRYVYCGAHGVT